jgi:hypothetical protein
MEQDRQTRHAGQDARERAGHKERRIDPEQAPFLRAENEDDDGYDPYSDRPPAREPLFEADPWT